MKPKIFCTDYSEVVAMEVLSEWNQCEHQVKSLKCSWACVWDGEKGWKIYSYSVFSVS